MIKAYNRRQIFRALGHLTVSLLATAATFALFFWFVSNVEARDHFPVFGEKKILITVGGTGFVYLVGLLHCWRENGFALPGPTDLFEQGSFSSQAGFAEKHVNSYATNAAAGLVTLFYAAPTRMIRAIQCLTDLIRFSPTLEQDLEKMLLRIKSVGEWHDARKYRAESFLMLYLVKMEQVDFSPHKGRIKAA